MKDQHDKELRDELDQSLALYLDLARRAAPQLDDPELILQAAWKLLKLYGQLNNEPKESPHPHLSLDDGIEWVALPRVVELRYNAIDHDGDEPLDLRIAAGSSGLYFELLAPETDSTLATAALDRKQLCSLPSPLGGTAERGEYTVGPYRMLATLDADTQLTLTVASTDGSQVIDTGEYDPGEGQFGTRLTTEKVERDYKAGQVHANANPAPR